MRKLYVNIIPALKGLEITTRSKVNTLLIGRYRSMFKGQGLEFEDYREYTQFDDASRIDWKASIRANQLLVREYMEERNLSIFLLIDASSSMIYGTTKKLKNEFAAELAISLGYAILQTEDSLGFALFNEGIVKDVVPSKGPKQFYLLTEILTTAKYYGGKMNLSKALEYVMNYIKGASLVIIISDFIGLDARWERTLETLAIRNEVIGIMIRDPVDEKLPSIDKRVKIEDPYTGRQIVVDTDSVREEYERVSKQHARNIENTFLKYGADFLKLYTDKSFVQPVLEFFNARGKKWR